MASEERILNLGLFLPELSLAISAIVVVLLDLFIKRKGALAVISLVGLVVAAGFTIAMRGTVDSALTNRLLRDGTDLWRYRQDPAK